jgi:hypothetical protein
MRRLLKLIGVLLVVGLAAPPAAAAPTLQIGTNFTGSTFNVDSFIFPPDTDGAVGQRHIVELINGHYAAYLKRGGTRVQSTSLDRFWTDAGASVRGFLTDPRVLFDPFSRRWYASAMSINFGVGPDDLLFAVSKGAEPTQGWAGFTVPFAGPVGTFTDFPTLGFDRDGVFLFSNGSVLVVPKTDLQASPPTIAHATLLQSRDLLTPSGTKMQPIVSLDNTALPEPLLGPWDVEGTLFRHWRIVGSVSTPLLDASDGFIAVTPYQSMGGQGALQRDSGITISTSSPMLVSSVVMRNAVMWGVQTVANQGRAALRWFAIDSRTNALLQEGLIADPVLDVYMGSIAVNACNDVVIGFNQSGPGQFVSAYALAGTTARNVTTFGEPLLLKAGVARYDETGGAPFARWGDYSATVVDPRHPLTFWTFQEWPSADGIWSTQITELKLHKGGQARRDDEENDDRQDDDARGENLAMGDAGCRAR